MDLCAAAGKTLLKSQMTLTVYPLCKVKVNKEMDTLDRHKYKGLQKVFRVVFGRGRKDE